MKKILTSVIALVMVVCNAFGQQSNKITISTSDNLPLLLGSMIGGGVIGSLTDAPMGQKLGDVSSHGCFTLGYTHYINSRFGFGGDLTYAGAKIKFEDDKTGKVVDSNDANIFMVMATAKCNYFQKGILTIGGDMGVGYMTDFDGTSSLAWQMNPLDLRLGNEKFGATLGLGFGVKGIFTLGVDYCF